MHGKRFSKETRLLAFTLPFMVLCLLYIDRIVISWLKHFRNSNQDVALIVNGLDPLLNFITHGATQIALLILFLFLGWRTNRRVYEAGKILSIGFILSGIAVQVLKHVVGRARPRITDLTVFIGPTLKSGYDSFPSGHTSVTFCLAFIISYHFPSYRVLVYTYAFLTALVRIENTAHFPSDVLAGAVLGLLIGSKLVMKYSTSVGIPSASLAGESSKGMH